MTFSQVRKAAVAGVAAAVAALVTAWPDGVTDTELAAIVGAAVVAGLAVFRIPNADGPGRPTSGSNGSG
jgi:hypothetical protein